MTALAGVQCLLALFGRSSRVWVLRAFTFDIICQFDPHTFIEVDGLGEIRTKSMGREVLHVAHGFVEPVWIVSGETSERSMTKPSMVALAFYTFNVLCELQAALTMLLRIALEKSHPLPSFLVNERNVDLVSLPWQRDWWTPFLHDRRRIREGILC